MCSAATIKHLEGYKEFTVKNAQLLTFGDNSQFKIIILINIEKS